MLLAAYAVGFSLVHVVATLRGWYYLFAWIDIPMHVGGGALVAWAAIAYRRQLRTEALPRAVQALFVICAVALAGVLWEAWEAFVDACRIAGSGVPLAGIPDAFLAAPYNQRWDTLLDLVNDLAGAALVVAAWLCRGGRRP